YSLTFPSIIRRPPFHACGAAGEGISRRQVMQRILLKIVVVVALVASYSWLSGYVDLQRRPEEIATALQQLGGDWAVSTTLSADHAWRSQAQVACWILIGVIAMTIFSTEIRKLVTSIRPPRTADGAALILLALALPTMIGCWRPFEPVQLETINPNEEAF